ncbi:SLC13 family permease [Sinomonas atrocyanea]|jgi:GntP family gluconate:H+ symporter|uniref:GntP family permease n=1 Tax=Sinomonas atrocyanea TaxID=37927 RepID=UPI00285B6517|nr:SLC13 family permease [Sinomonas atrocyanea]MDR6620302.1 GntP family gluconate:H+ symporter [Sinomonas atrocyanea]
MTAHAWFLVAVLMAAVALLITLINSRLKLHPFIALLVVSVLTGLVAGEKLTDIPTSIISGAGGVLGNVGITLALGAMLGRLLSDAGATDRLAELIVSRGTARSFPWMMTLAAFVIGIPMFFEVGLIILLPFIFGVAERIKRTRPDSKPYVLVVTPAIAALATLHGMVPPHPGPLTSVSGLHADLGKTIIVGFVCAIPTVILSGPVFARWLSRRMTVEPDMALVAQFTHPASVEDSAAPGAGVAVSGFHRGPGATERTSPIAWAVACILLPIVLMLAQSIGQVFLAAKSPALQVLELLGNPVVAMMCGVLLALLTLARFKPGEQVRSAVGESLKPVVGILLIIGAGGAFNKILVDSHIGDALAQAAQHWQLNVLILGWVLSLILSTATGSATVGIVSATGMVAQMPAAGGDPWQVALLVIAIGAGSIGLNYVNHAGFWLVKESFGMTLGQATRLHTTVQTLVSVIALGMVLLLSLLV